MTEQTHRNSSRPRKGPISDKHRKHLERVQAGNMRHGLCGHPLYSVYRAMLARCFNRSHKSYKDYGAKGITVCERWLTFANFIEDMGERPEGMSIDRIDGTGNYEPGNCRWATTTEQQRNRSSNLLVEIDGVTKCITEWCEIFGTCRKRAYCRIRKGWTPEDAVRKAKVDAARAALKEPT